jgi:hypothetical protein
MPAHKSSHMFDSDWAHAKVYACLYQICGRWPTVRERDGLASVHHMRWKNGQSFDLGVGSGGLAERHISRPASSPGRRLRPAMLWVESEEERPYGRRIVLL